MYDQLYNVALTWLILITFVLAYTWLVRLRYTKRCISFFVFKWILISILAIFMIRVCSDPFIWTPIIFVLLISYLMLYCLEINKEMDRYKALNAPEVEIEEFRKKIKKELIPWAILFVIFILGVIILACNKIIL